MKHGFVAAGLEQVQNAVDHARVQAGRVQKITEGAMLRRRVEDDVFFHHQFLRSILHINAGEHFIVPHGIFKGGRMCEITFQRDKAHGSAVQRYTEAVSRRELHRQGKCQVVRGVFIGRHTVLSSTTSVLSMACSCPFSSTYVLGTGLMTVTYSLRAAEPRAALKRLVDGAENTRAYSDTSTGAPYFSA